jgi:hypothetical protein
MKRFSICVVFTLLLFGASALNASAGTIIALPGDVPDEEEPRGISGDYPTGWGSGSWQGPATGKSNYHVWYTAQMETLFGAGHGITVGDLSSLSYYTKKDASIPWQDDWWLSIYTVPEGDGDDSGSWYDSRLHARPDIGPGYSQSFTYGQWNLWATDNSGITTNQLQFYDSGRGWNGYYATLASLAAGEVTWGNSQSHDYSDEIVKAITIQTDSGWDGFDGQVDGLTITLNDGQVGEVNFEPVPVPAAVWLLGSGLIGLVGIKRKCRPS